jgi:outer membrane biosynthesis protein TonB/DNA-directed RNA polymerase subunit RPC12/RpoP
MIRFQCPVCNSVINAQDERTGDKIACPKCGQRLQIPTPPRPKPTPTVPLVAPAQIQPAAPSLGKKAATPQLKKAAPDKVVVSCRGCGVTIGVALSQVGQALSCPRCGHSLAGDAGRRGRAPAFSILTSLLLGMVCVPAAVLTGSPWLGALLALPGLVLGLFALLLCLFGGRRGLPFAVPGPTLCLPAFVLLLLFAIGRFEAARPLWDRGNPWAKAVTRSPADSPRDDEDRKAPKKDTETDGPKDKQRERPRDKDGAPPKDKEPERPKDGQQKEQPKDPPQPKDAGKDKDKRPKDEEKDKDKEPPKPKESELDRLVRQLKDKDSRSAAARELGKLGEKARPAAAALCEALASANDDEHEALLDALEKIRPDLHKHVVTLMVDEDVYNHSNALAAIEKLKRDGAPVVPLLLAYGKRMAEEKSFGKLKNLSGSRSGLLARCIKALRSTSPANPQVIAFLSPLVTYASQDRFSGFADSDVRGHAIAALHLAGKEDPKVRKKLVPVFLRGVAAQSPYQEGERDVRTALLAMAALGELGPEAKEALPALKKEKLNANKEIREAASAAVAKIDKEE